MVPAECALPVSDVQAHMPLHRRRYTRNWKGELLCIDVKGTGGVS